MDFQVEINQAKTVANQNKVGVAVSILKGVLQKDPKNIEAWLTLSEFLDNEEHIKNCLERVLQLDPRNQIARQRLDQLLNPEIPLFLQGVEDFGTEWGQPKYEENQPKKTFALTTPDEGSSQKVETESVQVESVTDPEKNQLNTESKKQAPKKKSNRTLEIALVGVLVIILCAIAGLVVLPKDGTFLALKPTPTIEDPRLVIQENMRAANAEDIDAYMATIYPRTLVLAVTESTLKDLNERFDLSYRATNLQILEQDGKEARVSFVLTTKKIRGPAFRNNQATGVFILRKHEGRWKIYDQEIENVEYFD
jgi:flagellar basal body-associated protein FliL